MSTFNALSQIISVNDICEEFISEFDNSKSVESVWEEWSTDLCIERALDPMEQIALVKQNQISTGWIGFDMLDSSKTLSECMAPISSDILLSSDTPLLEAIFTVCNSNDPIFIVLKGNQFIGYLTYNHFHKLPFRMCLFALLLDLERMMLEITKSNPSRFLRNLNEKRITDAKRVYGLKGFSKDKENKEYESKLVDCTTFIDKFKMMRKNETILKICPNIKGKFADKAEKIRNSIAHPGNKESELLPIKRQELLPFLQWVEELQRQLSDYILVEG